MKDSTWNKFERTFNLSPAHSLTLPTPQYSIMMYCVFDTLLNITFLPFFQQLKVLFNSYPNLLGFFWLSLLSCLIVPKKHQ